MFSDLSIAASVFLGVAILLALAFEFVNGFHDTANAVATVIYTNTLKPTTAVIWSGLWNLIGVLGSSGAVAFGIVALLPIDLIMNVGSGAGFAMVFSLLISAILWNLGTWYFGLPASSSHTLIGSILGVGLANAMLKGGGGFAEGVNWGKAREVGISLLASPLIGFVAAGALLMLLKWLLRIPELYREPAKGQAPPLWIRAVLVLTCTGVSFAHGSNDGQKGMGLIVLILVGILPGTFALNPAITHDDINSIHAGCTLAESTFSAHAQNDPLPPGQDTLELSSFLKPKGAPTPAAFAAAAHMSLEIRQMLDGKSESSDLTKETRGKLRTNAYLVSEAIAKMEGAHAFSAAERAPILQFKSDLDRVVKYIPYWVKIAVALALGLGTMIGWQRIVVTVGEKIGKTHLSYAQGAAAELVTAITIGGLDTVGLPVSTTHVLSSGVAGTMAANHSGIQLTTLRNLLLAWVLTLPVCVFLGAMLFALGLNIVVGLGMR